MVIEQFCAARSFGGPAEHDAPLVASSLAATDRDRLEHLCRYAGRPAVAESRLSLLPDGRVAYSLKKRWKDGTSSVVMTKQVLLERLCALVPRPRRHLVTYHGVFAPAAGIRPFVVPRVAVADGGGAAENGEADAGAEVDDEAGRRLQARRVVPHAPRKRRRGQRRYSWAELLRRVHLIDVLVCNHCGGTRRLLAAIHDPESIRKVLGAMGLSAEVSVLCPARAPPRQQELEW